MIPTLILPRIIEYYWHPQFMRFLIFSGIAALTNLSAGYLFYEIFGLKHEWTYGLSITVAFLAGMVVSFWLNRKFTFDSSGRSAYHEMVTFVVVSLGGLLLTMALAYLFRASIIPALVSPDTITLLKNDGLTVEMMSHFSAVGLVTFYSFFCHKVFSFGKGIRNHLPGHSSDVKCR